MKITLTTIVTFAAAFLFVVSGALAFPTPVSASPAEDNIISRTQPREVCMAASGGVREVCSTGAINIFVNGIADLLSVSNLSYEDFANQELALARNDITSAQKIVRDAGGGGLGSLIFEANYAMLDQRPASGVLFVSDQIAKATSAEPVMAAEPAPYFPGTGFTLMQPILAFWGWSLTISYSFMVLIIIGVAFSMMFRSQIDGTTFVQIQNAIPGIVMAMILIPLSYPISGIFIDAITLSTNMYHDFLFGPAGPGRDVYTQAPVGENTIKYNADGSRGLYADDWRLNVFRFYERIGVNKVADAAKISICPDETDGQVCEVANTGILGLVKGFMEWVFGGVADSNILGNFLNLLFSLVAIVVSIRIAKRLLIKLITLMFMPIAAPFIFATLAIPGQGTKNVVNYLKSLGAASLFFIVTYIIFTTTLVLTNEYFYQTIPNVSTYEFRPPLLGALGAAVTGTVSGNVNSDGTGSSLGASGFLFTLVGAFLFLSTPKILDSINERLGVSTDLIPKALKPYIDDISYSADYGLRQLPANARVAVDTIGGGAIRNTVGRVGKAIGSNKPNPFGDSVAEDYIDNRRKEIAKLQAEKAATSNPLKRAALDAQILALQTRGNIRSNFYGEGSAFSAKSGEEGVNFTAEISFPDLEGAYNFTPDSFELLLSSKATIGGALTIEVVDKSTPPEGNLVFRPQGNAASGIIAKLVPAGEKDSSEYFAVRITEKGLSVTSEGIVLSNKSFSGQKKLRVNVELIYVSGASPATLRPSINVFSTVKDTKGMVMVGKTIKDIKIASIPIRPGR